MANVYVDSNAAGAGTGADWANAYTTLGAAATAKAAGDTFYVAHNHAETAAAAKTITFPGTSASPNRVFCVNSGGTVPPVSADLRTTGTITTTGNNAITVNGSTYIYGLTFSSGSGAVSAPIAIGANASTQIYESCALVSGGTNSAVNTLTGSSVNNRVRLINTTLKVSNTSSFWAVGNGFLEWLKTPSAIQGATLPTTLFSLNVARGCSVLIEGVDLSALGSGKTLVGGGATPQRFVFKDCKLGSSVTVCATPDAPSSMQADLIRCDSGDTNYRTERYRYEGTETTETTVVLTGGASDGANSFAKKIVTTANAKPSLPFEAIPISFWNETTGSAITVTLQGIWGGGAVPNNNDIWLEAEYLGTSGVPLGSFVSDGLADPLATAAGQDAGSGTWGGSTTKFKLNVTFTPQEKGPVTLYVKAGAASSTFYIDAKPVVT